MPQLILACDARYQELLTNAARCPHWVEFSTLHAYCSMRATILASQRKYCEALVYRMEAQDWLNAYTNWGKLA